MIIEQHAYRYGRNGIQALPSRERGYILLLVAVFMLVLMGSSAQFFSRVTENASLSGGRRDNNEAAMLAESALNHLMGPIRQHAGRQRQHGCRQGRRRCSSGQYGRSFRCAVQLYVLRQYGGSLRSDRA